MFEKSLYELIRGLRHHKGNEKEYIQSSLRECRKEIKGQDMGLKATALLKLTYLEMFGHDMSWASFNVLEVMSSPNYAEKRIGYLGAIQSFRSNTDVLVLAENLLKKDIGSPTAVVISLPLTAVPHVINASMANSLLTEILPRLTHSNPSIRKKTIVTLYRLALVYPDTLRPAWPKIKDRLLDENEDPSVTSAIVNVVCELGWRRPQDFLPLAPRLFDLLVEGGNNWMAIKLIKLFATLTPLEPRLIKKLLPPLTSIIKTTPAMSLLYECVNGIIEGGILASIEGTTEGEEIARLCVGKLGSMLVIEGDPNLKYVALLSFEKIVQSHPHLVSLHQDVLLECIDDFDISIRSRAMSLVVGMVNSENLITIVDRLLQQLLTSPLAGPGDDPANDRSTNTIDPYAESDEDEAGESLRQNEAPRNDLPPLPDDYRVQVIRNILDICSKDTYANLTDFEWYIDILIKLVRSCPMIKDLDESSARRDVSYNIGNELRNVAVRVKALRSDATIAAQSLVLTDNRDTLFPSFTNGGIGVLDAAGWIVGEYADYLTLPDAVVSSILHTSTTELPSHILLTYLQGLVKVFASTVGKQQSSWTPQRRTNATLLMARIIYFLEPLVNHSSLDVQETAIEILELIRLASEAASSQSVSEDGEYVDPPLLLTQAVPALFVGAELKPVAPGAMQKVQPPADLDLDSSINENLPYILRDADNDFLALEEDDFEEFYHQPEETTYVPETAADRLDLAGKVESYSYQESEPLDTDALAKKRAERLERNKDDPFYIGKEDDSSAASRLHNIIKNSNGDDLDIDSIPIMDLNLEGNAAMNAAVEKEQAAREERRRKAEKRKKIQIMADATLGDDSASGSDRSRPELIRSAPSKSKKSLLSLDSSGLGSLSLEDRGAVLDIEQREEEEKALREVERLRLEMQRAAERIHAKEEGTVVRKKKKKPKPSSAEDGTVVAESTTADGGAPVIKKKKKKKKLTQEVEAEAANGEGDDGVDNPPEPTPEVATAKPKRKKKRVVDLTEEAA